ncbi:FtsQ-type POTRA domain-containing protein [Pseudoclavibacter sp. VKM Ac-2867]|uniref:FtsQ-type POTRA domain-containing protein n=1 Tax=Pseudoclavibacter sp. VKM Ac-2867 TaxID=2783829 RepID=UPI00188B4713|nr:FtsQ-type POTRA domain-containing protein [Pseudoclavibacter sp. VKM Ac-2867]MBF4458683.1 FtsQ-type POTRA domain-containing protein [Pseudoclavibacter sp. VKM Ac-2867]
MSVLGDEARRFTWRARRRRRILLWIAAALAALVAFVAVAVYSPIMSVREIVVSGAERVDKAQIDASFADLNGQPLALVTNEDVESRLQSYVLVQSYSIRVEPPSRLVVTIVERSPIGTVQVPAGYDVMDAAGVVLWTQSEPAADIPTLELDGQGVDSEAFASAAAVSLALPVEFRSGVAAVTAKSIDDVRLTMRSGAEVVWGSAEESDRKAEVLAALVAATAEQSISSYDVSSPETPVTR